MRTKPNFGKKESVTSSDNDDPWGCIRIPVAIVISYFVLKAIVSYTSGTGSKLDQYVCCGALIIFVIIMLLGVAQMAKDSLAVDEEKQQWKNGCKSTEVAIVNRDGYAGGSYEDEYGIPHTVRPRYRLTLKLPNQIDANVDVSESIFKKLENRNTARIYYKPDSPMTFMLEEEF